MDAASLASHFMSWGGSLVENWGYAGIFFINMASSASLIVPVPYFIFVFAAGAVLNPVLVGIIGGLGAAIGQLLGYAIGAGGKKVAGSKQEKLLRNVRLWSEKHGFFAVVAVFAATPLPDSIISIIGGAIGYDLKKFFIASLIGKVALNLAIAFAGFYGSAWVLGMLGGI